MEINDNFVPRPADLIYPDRRKAYEQKRCLTPPIGCGKPIDPTKDFKDIISLKEWLISGLCQECQDSIFDGILESEEDEQDEIDRLDKEEETKE